MDKTLYEFPVYIYGNLEKYNEVLSKARCRIFYKYGNRNGTYITDEFAEHLLSSVAYVPVKGIYDGDDFTDHGNVRSEGRIYGIVPENYNFAWEDHVDKDGVTRTYACVDVLIFTALYEEASDIIGKSQSMELYGPSLKYHEAIVDGKRYIVFDDGCFLGLQTLGDTVEPCFEGASFYTLQNTIEFAINQIKKYGGTKMPKITFKLSDEEKFNAIWALLNPEFNEEGNWTVTYGISAVYDDYALAYSYETGEFYRAYYTKNDENNMIELGNLDKCYIIDVTEQEKQTVDTLRALNGDSYELVSDVLTNAQENFEKVTEFSTKIEELNETISTLETEKSEFASREQSKIEELEAANNSIASLNEELNTLQQYKAAKEAEAKQNVINEYTELLSESILEQYAKEMDKYTADELDKELAYEVKKTNSSIYTKKNGDNGYLPKEVPLEGINAILSKYKK